MSDLDANFLSIMDDIHSGAAFDTSIINNLGAMDDQWSDLATNQNTLFGQYSPINGYFDGLHDLTPLTTETIDDLVLTDTNGNPITLTSDQKSSLVGKASGALSIFKEQASNQLGSLVNNMTLYASHQNLQNSMGTSTLCNSLNQHFGTITAIGHGIAQTVLDAKNATDNYKMLKTQIQSEITSLDHNIINLMTGRINGTILSSLVAGTGLYDQIDKVLVASGVAHNSADAAYIRTQAGALLSSSVNGRNFYTKKDSVTTVMSTVHSQKSGMFNQVIDELQSFKTAVTTLRKYSDATALITLFKSNVCSQTILGFAGTSSLLNKINQISL